MHCHDDFKQTRHALIVYTRPRRYSSQNAKRSAQFRKFNETSSAVLMRSYKSTKTYLFLPSDKVRDFRLQRFNASEIHWIDAKVFLKPDVILWNVIYFRVSKSSLNKSNLLTILPDKNELLTQSIGTDKNKNSNV